jgi:hypothetical protein
MHMNQATCARVFLHVPEYCACIYTGGMHKKIGRLDLSNLPMDLYCERSDYTSDMPAYMATVQDAPYVIDDL